MKNIMPVRRDVKLNLPEEKVSNWHEQGPHVTHFMNALSLFFPAGERMFMDAVRNYRDDITDPELKKAVVAFIGQEAMHSQAHAGFNALIQADDYRLQSFEAEMASGMATLRSRSPRRQLAATVAYEHFTALIAAHLLSRPHLFDGFDPNLRQLWLWHALEELEHKAVAFNVYRAVFGKGADSLAQRRRSMRTVSLGFVMGVATMTGNLLWQDRKASLGSPRKLLLNIRDAVYLLDLVVSTLPDYLAFYKADFHPDDTDHAALIARWRQALAA